MTVIVTKVIKDSIIERCRNINSDNDKKNLLFISNIIVIVTNLNLRCLHKFKKKSRLNRILLVAKIKLYFFVKNTNLANFMPNTIL